MRFGSMDDHNLRHHDPVPRGILGVRMVSRTMFLEP